MPYCINESLGIEIQALRDILRKTSWHKELLRRLHARCPVCINSGGEITSDCLDCPQALWNRGNDERNP